MPVTLDDDLDNPWPDRREVGTGWAKRSRLMPDPDDPRNGFDVVGPQPPRRTCVFHTDCDAADPGERHFSAQVIRDPDAPKGKAYLISKADAERFWGLGTTTIPRESAREIAEQRAEASGNPKDAIGDTKPPLHLVPAALAIYASQAMKNGAAKYGPFNWRKNPVRAEVYVSACLRHLAAWFDGEDHAEDSGVHHLAHAAAGLAILLDAMATGNLIDNRPTPGPSSRLIAEFTETGAA